MNLIYNIDPLLYIGGRVDGLVPQGPDLVHAVVGGGVQLHHVQKAAVLDAKARRTPATGIPALRVLAVDGLGQDLGAGGLAGAPGAGEEVRMGGAALRHLPAQRLRDVGLADDVRKRLGPPFPIQRLVQKATSQKSILRMQLRNRRPRGTWNIPLNAARFPA